MSDMDRALRGAIRDLVDDVRVDARLAGSAIAVGRRIRSRRRRHSVLAAAVAVALASTGGAVVAARTPPRGDGRTPASTAAARTTTLPAAPEQPGAAKRPEAIGSDPGILHFDLDMSAVGDGTRVHWFVDNGTESVLLFGFRSTNMVSIAVTDRAPRPMTAPIEPEGQAAGTIERRQTTVNGRPATMERLVLNGDTNVHDRPPPWYLTWQPVDGVWVRVEALERDFITLANALRLDRAQRCVVPMLVTVPPGSQLSGCSIQTGGTGAGALPWSHADFDFIDPSGQPHRVALGLSGVPEFQPNRTVLGKPAMWKDNGLAIQGFHGAFDLYASGPNEAEVMSLVLGLRIVPDLAAWDTWPHRPF